MAGGLSIFCLGFRCSRCAGIGPKVINCRPANTRDTHWGDYCWNRSNFIGRATYLVAEPGTEAEADLEPHSKRWILIFPTSRLPPWWAICRWGILISRYINIAHLGYNTIFLSCMPLSCIQNGPSSIFDLVCHFWDQLNTLKKLTNSANSQL